MERAVGGRCACARRRCGCSALRWERPDLNVAAQGRSRGAPAAPPVARPPRRAEPRRCRGAGWRRAWGWYLVQRGRARPRPQQVDAPLLRRARCLKRPAVGARSRPCSREARRRPRVFEATGRRWVGGDLRSSPKPPPGEPLGARSLPRHRGSPQGVPRGLPRFRERSLATIREVERGGLRHW